MLIQDLADFADELSFDEQAAGRRAAEIGVDVAATDFVIRFEVFADFSVIHVSFTPKGPYSRPLQRSELAAVTTAAR